MIVLAGVAQSEGHVLIARRLMNKSNGGLWEFPGGKLEDGETDAEALVREFREEFSVAVSVGSYLGEFPYKRSTLSLMLRVYYLSDIKGELIPVDHSEVRWVAISELAGYEFSPADIPVVTFLQENSKNTLR